MAKQTKTTKIAGFFKIKPEFAPVYTHTQAGMTFACWKRPNDQAWFCFPVLTKTGKVPTEKSAFRHMMVGLEEHFTAVELDDATIAGLAY